MVFIDSGVIPAAEQFGNVKRNVRNDMTCMFICGGNLPDQPVYFMAQFFDPSLVQMENWIICLHVI